LCNVFAGLRNLCARTITKAKNEGCQNTYFQK